MKGNDRTAGGQAARCSRCIHVRKELTSEWVNGMGGLHGAAAAWIVDM